MGTSITQGTFGTGTFSRVALVCASFLTLAACEPFEGLNLAPRAGSEATGTTGGKSVERDVEAPEIFQVSERGLWDGRPSLGGVWVAHSDVTEPARVIVRNTQNNQFVVGALFKRESGAPGPGVQVSSDAAEALGMLAGAPAELNVTALRREVVAAPETAETLAAAPEVQTTTLDDPIAAAGAALDAADSGTASAAPAPSPTTSAPTNSSLSKPFVQIGIFSVESNAQRTVQMLGSQGIVALTKKGSSNGKDFWRVLVGPAATSAQRKDMLTKVKSVGFTDAYAVTH